jgi:hypothetical protein
LYVEALFATNSDLFDEKSKPSVAITSPKANSRSKAPILSGTASDKLEVESVSYWITNLNNGVAQISSGQADLVNGTQWSITSPALLPGTNILVVQSYNYSGLASSLAKAAFFYQVTAPFALLAEPKEALEWITTAASVKGDPPPDNGAKLYIGEGYKLTAVPPKGYLLVGWMENGTNLSAKSPFTFIMEPGLAVTAAFTTDNGASGP